MRPSEVIGSMGNGKPPLHRLSFAVFLNDYVLDLYFSSGCIASEIQKYAHLVHIDSGESYPAVGLILIFRQFKAIGHLEYVVVVATAGKHALECHSGMFLIGIECDAEVVEFIG